MKRMLINATQDDELRVALTNNALLVDLDVERPGVEQKKANIYLGKITSIEPSLAAVFVNYGSERHGFLPLKEISPEYFSSQPSGDEPVDINKVLKLGQQVVVQVDKEERGTKGAALTTFLSLAGSYLVLMPNNPRAGGISRRIEGEERDQLRDTLSKLTLPDGMGVIIRTAGVSKSTEELQWDLDVLLKYFDAIKQAAGMQKPAPYLIHQESDVVIRTLRDYLRQDIGEVVIDEKEAHTRAYNYIKQIRPDFAERIKLYEDSIPLYSRFQIEQQIETAYQREVRLPSGGSVVIDQTEALVAIDINSARATKGKSIEETALNTNVEAAEEIARQLRLRDIGGLIVIDFIDMMQNRNQREVENVLRTALHPDRARIQIGRISRFGLLEMSRQRLRSAVHKSTRIPCPRCSGTGAIRSVESLAISIIHLIQEQATKTDKAIFQVQLPVDVATFIINEQRDKITEIEKHGVKVTIVPNQHLQTPHYNIRHLRSGNQGEQSVPSYKLLRGNKTETQQKAAAVNISNEEPLIKQFLDEEKKQPETAASGEGVIRRLLKKMFSSSPVEEAPKQEEPKKRQHNNRNRSGQQRNRSGQQRNRSGNNQNRRPSNRNENRNENRNDNRTDNQNDDRRRSGGNRSRSDEDRKQDEQSSNTQQQRSRRGTRGGQSNKQGSGNRNQQRRRPSHDKSKEKQDVDGNKAPVNTVPPKDGNKQDAPKAKETRKPTTAASPEINDLANENNLSDKKPAAKTKAKPAVKQKVEQRQMTAGRRISPQTKKPEAAVDTTPKPKPPAGRKIIDASGAKVTTENQKADD
ncbi:MAG: Rne/Rng family ribonuclease [Coxiellaceae bacterium]|nr:Rne/Rng family ribonuclease [Coxiellaceae bacterium]